MLFRSLAGASPEGCQRDWGQLPQTWGTETPPNPSLAQSLIASASVDLVPSPPSELFAQLALPLHPAPPHPVLPGWEGGLRMLPRVPGLPGWGARIGFPRFGVVRGLSPADSPGTLGWGQCPPTPTPGQNERIARKCCSCSLAPWVPSRVWATQVAGVLRQILRLPH